jgi:hypothetical protein
LRRLCAIQFEQQLSSWCVIFGALALRRAVGDSIRNTHSGTEPGFDRDAAGMMSPKELKDEACGRSWFPAGRADSNFQCTTWVPNN